MADIPYMIYSGDGLMFLDCKTTVTLPIMDIAMSDFRFGSFFFNALTRPHHILYFDKEKAVKIGHFSV